MDDSNSEDIYQQSPEPLVNNDDDLENLLGSDGEETEALTAAQVIAILESTWMNEKFAPEILPHKSEVVDCILGQITYMEQNLESLESADIQKSLHQMEVDRLRYLVISYLRTRLEKIELFAQVILKQEQARRERNEEPYLTEDELQFAKDFDLSIEEHFATVLKFGTAVSQDEWKKEAPAPNLHSFVFLKSNAEIEGVMIDDANDEEGDLVDFKTGSQMIISYNSVSNLVKKGDVQLI